jgi:hypothetical protein
MLPKNKRRCFEITQALASSNAARSSPLHYGMVCLGLHHVPAHDGVSPENVFEVEGNIGHQKHYVFHSGRFPQESTQTIA